MPKRTRPREGVEDFYVAGAKNRRRKIRLKEWKEVWPQEACRRAPEGLGGVKECRVRHE